MSEFRRENRYLVIKWRNAVSALGSRELEQLQELAEKVTEHRGKPLECVVVESDWPIYEQVWDLVKQQAENAQLLTQAIPEGSAAIEIPAFPELDGLADLEYAINTPPEWCDEYRTAWQRLQVAERNKVQIFAYAKNLRNLLMSVNGKGGAV